MVEKFVTELEAAVEEMVQSRLREVVQSLYGGEGAPGGRAKSQSVADLRAAFGLPAATIVATAPALLSAGRIGEPTRARPGRCVGVIAGGRRCGRAAPPGDPPLCSFCRATVALVAGGTARVSITVTTPTDSLEARPEPIRISAPGPAIDPGLVASRKERCKGVLLGGGSCRSRVMPPDDLCPWCRALGVRAVAAQAELPVSTTPTV